MKTKKERPVAKAILNEGIELTINAPCPKGVTRIILNGEIFVKVSNRRIETIIWGS